ncbi:hypothetical protein PMAYCL1PPCAC_01487 [Pristionchus mayeri]|uniref:Uncharacterized protein n=1 Tax=Pristionchus mayeri TaxID=1317129 RepID=A0AAN5C622_9BILA|nr:hypothetical protein PMAYCL1PPCAC_01487 [Pristionchus mayeri]
MYGLIEALHLTLTHLTEDKMDSYERSVATIEEWKRKSCEFSNGSADPLASVIYKGFELMLMIVKNFEHNHIVRALGSFDFERTQSLRFDGVEEFSIRSLMYGVIESVHLTLQHLAEKKYQTSHSKEASTDKCDIETSSQNLNLSFLLLKEPKEEPLEMEQKDEPIDVPLSDGSLKLFSSDFIGDGIKEEEMLNDDFMVGSKRRRSSKGESQSKKVKMVKENTKDNKTE